ncbi:glutamyl-tRNA reductase [Roseivirga sp. BDSF3-8]|uniref:glutamyl-tRNA reductase n=1 Tax=Roseivirga sp. BDSF3-8 TaxID=3241598 RepID=UPI003532072C
MQARFKVVSISHRHAPLKIREMVSLGDDGCKRLLDYFSEYTSMNDVMVLSTCNRTEVYYSADDDRSDEIIKLIGIEKGHNNLLALKEYFTIINDSQSAARHLFRVAIGLEAMVVGDMQITNQVKRAYQLSADLNMAGPYLHRLMHTIFFTNKRVVQETPFRDGAASVSYAAVELVDELTSEINAPRILVLGLGEIGADVCRNLDKMPRADVRITNRTASKADALAAETGFETVTFAEVDKAMQEADVIISSVSGQEPFISGEKVKEMNILTFKYFIDLSVPRSVAAEVEHQPGALIYNIDNIRTKASEALERRSAAIPAVEAIIEEALLEFKDWARDMVVSPTINKLKNALEEIRKEEMARYLKKGMSDQEARRMDKVTKSMMQKIIKMPVLNLKAACRRGDAENLIDVLNDLFNLENEAERKV